jgi:hypothetical protein
LTGIECEGRGVALRMGVGEAVGDHVEPCFHWKKAHGFPSITQLHLTSEKVMFQRVEGEGVDILQP